MKTMYTIFDKIHDTIGRALERHDLSAWEGPAQKDVPVYGVYHIFCDKGWQTMVREQVANLKDSGLLDRTKIFYVSCITFREDDLDEIKSIIDSDKIQIISHTQDSSRFEYPALEFVHSKSKKEDCLIYYFHTKGITYQSVKTTDRKFNAFKRNIESWRKMMEYFLFHKWNVAVNALCDGYDTYGCYRLPPPPRPYYLYAGNFWWANSAYLRTLPDFDRSKMSSDRFFAEEWLYKGYPKDFSAFDTMADLYYVNMRPELYEDGKSSLVRRMQFVWLYNIRKFRKQILKYDYKKHYQKKYQKLKY